MTTFIDARGHEVELPRTPRRIVSLVPSTTETLLDLAIAKRVVGRTHFCIRPAEGVKSVTAVGGTKSVNADVVDELSPDLILANMEENRADVVVRLERVAPVYVAFPRSVSDAIRDIGIYGQMVGAEEQARQLAMRIGSQLGALRAAGQSVRYRFAYLIWRQPYMAVGRDTFTSSLLEEGGGRNVFGEREERYPKVSLAELFAADPDVVFLPSEPFNFLEKHKVEILHESGEPERWEKRLVRVPGHQFCWHGSRLLDALPHYRRLLSELPVGSPA